jgi:hypothetical protein
MPAHAWLKAPMPGFLRNHGGCPAAVAAGDDCSQRERRPPARLHRRRDAVRTDHNEH